MERIEEFIYNIYDKCCSKHYMWTKIEEMIDEITIETRCDTDNEIETKIENKDKQGIVDDKKVNDVVVNIEDGNNSEENDVYDSDSGWSKIQDIEYLKTTVYQ